MNTPEYWDDRYRIGLGAGSGSRGQLYLHKLRTVQSVVDTYGIKSVLDLGCGDGVQLSSLKVGKYIGLDVSEVGIISASSFAGEDRLYGTITEDAISKAGIVDMAVSLDVIQHMPDDQFEAHLKLLFHLSKRYVLIYAPNNDGEGIPLASHMVFRKFVPYIRKHYGLKPINHIKNPHLAVGSPAKPGTSYSEFYLFDKTEKVKGKKGK